MIYLDSAATSFQKPPSVLAAVTDAMQSLSSSGRGFYKNASDAADMLLDLRTELAQMFCVSRPENVIFCFNATHALNIAVKSLVRPGDRVVISPYEHNAVTRPLHAAGAVMDIAEGKLFSPEELTVSFREKIPGAKAVFCTYVSNVFGYILPIEEIAALCRKHSVPLVIDASQAAGVLTIDFDRLGADFCAMPGHKGLMGPQGTGVLLVKENAIPLLYGGTGSESKSPTMPSFLPDRLEAGTHNIPGLAGLLAGCQWVKQETAEKIGGYEKRLMQQFCCLIQANKNIHCFTSPNPKLQSGVLSLYLKNTDAEEAARRLSEQGFAVRAGLHCAGLAHRSAGTDRDGTVRFSFSPFNREEEVYEAAHILMKIAG